MITRRIFLFSLIAGLTAGCTSRKTIGLDVEEKTIRLDVDETDPVSMVKSIKLNMPNVQNVTSGVIALQSYKFLMKSIGRENFVKIDEEDLIAHAHLVKKNITKTFADSFKIVESVRDEEQQLKKYADGKTVFISWRNLKKHLDDVVQSSGEVVSERVIRIMRELFAEDYKLIEGA